MARQDNTHRDHVLKLLRAGKISLSEAAEIAGVNRQLAYYWAKFANIDVNAARAAYLKKLKPSQR
jgi:hypothetical protein